MNDATTKSEKASDETTSTDWEKTLDEDEEVITRCAEVIKKVKAGDAMVAMDSMSLLEKIEKLTKEFEKQGDNMTSEQVMRFTSLQTKLAKIASEM